MKTHRKLAHAGMFILVLAAVAALVMLLWNALIPQIIGWSTIGYWQAAGLIILSRLLLGGIGKGHGHHSFHGKGPCRENQPFPREDLHRMHDHFHKMNRDERRDFIRRHMGGIAGDEEEKIEKETAPGKE